MTHLRVAFALSLLLGGTAMDAQCLQMLNCPSSPVVVCDSVNNNYYLWSEPYWWSAVYADADLREGAVDLCFSASDTCAGADLQIRYLLFLDLDGDGDRETVVRSDHAPGFGEVWFGNAGNPGYTGGEARRFDRRPVPETQRYGFALEQTGSAGNRTACLRWNTEEAPNVYVAPQLPYGTHRIAWIVDNGLGQTDTCAYEFEVRDCSPPTAVCFDGIAATIGASGQVTITVDDLSFATDNAASHDQIQRAIRRVGDGAGFPTDAAGNPQASLSFACSDLGEVPIEIWALDRAGNMDTCTTVLHVADNYALCGDTAQVDIRVCFRHWCDGAPVLGQVLDLDYWPSVVQGNITLSVDALGCWRIQGTLPALYNSFLVAPSMKTDPLNGVDLFDLVLINRHILGLSPLSSFAIIAADANNSRSVTTFDIITLRNLLTGMLTNFPGHSGATWRFVDAQYVFPVPTNPFLGFFSESQFLDTLQGVATFWAIKIGDVNCSAFPGLSPPAETRSPAYLHVPNRALRPGEVADIPVYFSEREDRLGFHLSLQYDPAQVAVEAVLPGDLPNWDEHSAVQPRPGLLHVLWYDTEARPLGPEGPALVLRLRALAPVSVQAVLGLAEGGRAEAYNRAEEKHRLALRFQEVAADMDTHIGDALPNPTTSSAGIALQMAQPGSVQLEVWDARGRLVWQQRGWAEAGLQQAMLPAAAFPTSGLYWWRATAGAVAKTGRLVVQR